MSGQGGMDHRSIRHKIVVNVSKTAIRLACHNFVDIGLKQGNLRVTPSTPPCQELRPYQTIIYHRDLKWRSQFLGFFWGIHPEKLTCPLERGIPTMDFQGTCKFSGDEHQTIFELTT